jgi:hypothetical protein
MTAQWKGEGERKDGELGTRVASINGSGEGMSEKRGKVTKGGGTQVRVYNGSGRGTGGGENEVQGTG